MPSVNILVLVDNVKFNYHNIYNSLSSALGKLNYCYHQLPEKNLLADFWQANCRLLVSAHSSLTESHKTKLMNFSQSGGTVFSIGASIFDFFSFRPYGRAASVQLVGSLPSMNQEFKEIERLIEFSPELNKFDHNVKIIAALDNETDIRTNIVIARIKIGKGNLVISAFDFFPESHSPLLRRVLTELGIHCCEQNEASPSGDVYFDVFSDKIDSIQNENLIFDWQKNVYFLKDTDYYFRLNYFSDGLHLFDAAGDAKVFKDRNLILFNTKTCPSTQDVAQKVCCLCPPETNLVVWSMTQTCGRGRGSNTWISPTGSVSVTCSYKISRNSVIGQKLVFVQYICAYSAVEAVRRLRPEINLAIKWPNDVYHNDSKVGGILVTSSFLGDSITFFCGIGLNVVRDEDPGRPNVSFLLIPHSTGLVVATIMDVFYSTLSRIETDGLEFFVGMYLELWLHSGTILFLKEKDCYVKIMGLSANGYLLAQEVDTGVEHLLYPDGNSLDMLHNMIILK